MFHKVSFPSHFQPKEFITHCSFLTHIQVRRYIAVLGPNANNELDPPSFH